MTIRNRELSQFGSYIYVDNSTQEIGITTGTLPFVGIGLTNPEKKLHVAGDVQIDGNLFYQGQLEFGDVDLFTTGIITARNFFRIVPGSDPFIFEELRAFDTWESSPTSVYNIDRNIGIGTTIPTEKLQIKDGNVSATTFISDASFGTPPLQVVSTTQVANLNASLLAGGIAGGNFSGDIITTDGTQTLSNKELELPTISVTGAKYQSSGGGSATLKSQNNILTDIEILLPSNNGTLISTGDTDIVSGDMITDFTIKNNNIAEDASIQYSKLNLTGLIKNSDIAPNAGIETGKLSEFTISNIPLGDNLRTLVAGNFITYTSSDFQPFTGSGYNGSEPLVISVKSSSTTNVPNTLVARNSSGDFTASNVTLTNLTVNQTLTTRTLNLDFLSCIDARVTGIITAGEFRRPNGLATQFLKADGSIDSNSYLKLSDLPQQTLTTVTNNGNVTSNSIQVGIITATELRRVGGTSSQFLKADGSVDSKVYITAADLPATATETLQTVTSRGSITTENIRAASFIRTNGTSSQFLKADGSIDSTNYLTSSGSATNLSALTDATPGTYGDSSNVAQIVVNSTGRITSITNVPISGGGGTGGVLSISDTSSGTYFPILTTATGGTISSANVSSSRISFSASTGNLTLSGGSFVSTSDRNKKTDIKTLENALDTVKKLNGVSFTWKETEESSLGLIAQEVEEILPNLVVTDEDGTKGVMYGNIVAVLIEAIKEQQVRIEELEKKVNA